MPKDFDDLTLDDCCPHCGKTTGGDSICPSCGNEIFEDDDLQEYEEEDLEE